MLLNLFLAQKQTLHRLKPFIKKSHVCEQIYFDINEWINSEDLILKNKTKV